MAFFKEYHARREIRGGNFQKGLIDFNVDQMGAINFAKSYFKLRFRMRRPIIRDVNNAIVANERQVVTSDGMGPNVFLADSLFQSIHIMAAGVTVEHVEDYVHQCGALRHRMDKSASWLNTIGTDSMLSQPNLSDRINMISSNGYDKLSSDFKQFTQLAQDDGTFVLFNEEIRVVIGTLNVIEYRQAADGGLGAVDLTQSELAVGDILFLNQAANINIVTTILAITANTITISDKLVAFAAEDILANKIRYEKPTNSSIASRRLSSMEIPYRPAMGLWKIDKFICGPWQLKFYTTAQSSFQKYAIESLIDKEPDIDFTFEIIDMIFYAWTIDDYKMKDGVKEIEIHNIRCKSRNVLTASKSDLLYNIDPHAKLITVAYQDSASTSDTSLSRGKFKVQGDIDLKLTSLYVSFKGQKLPNPNYEPAFDLANGGTDFTAQMYWERLIYSGEIDKCDIVSLRDWQTYGPYYNFKFKDDKSKDDRLVVSQSFDNLGGRVVNLLVFDHTMRKIKLTVKNRKIVGVKVSY